MNKKKAIEFLEYLITIADERHNEDIIKKRDQVIDLLEQGEKCRQNIDRLISKNPYPEDIFTPIPKEDFAKINDLLKKEMGYPLDRLSGHIGREFHKSLIETLKEMLDESSKV
jgi:hypothetical protein